MSLKSTVFDGTTLDTVQQSVTFETIKSGEEVVVTVRVYGGPPTGSPIQSQTFDLSANRPEESIQMNSGKPTLNGKLRLSGNVVTFHGRLITPSVVNTGLLPGIVAVL